VLTDLGREKRSAFLHDGVLAEVCVKGDVREEAREGRLCRGRLRRISIMLEVSRSVAINGHIKWPGKNNGKGIVNELKSRSGAKPKAAM